MKETQIDKSTLWSKGMGKMVGSLKTWKTINLPFLQKNNIIPYETTNSFFSSFLTRSMVILKHFNKANEELPL